jgi:hypothetical protein
MRLLLSFLLALVVLPAFSFEGGVSGGGGNIIAPKAPQYPVDPETAEHMVYHSHDLLKNYVAHKKSAFKNNQLSVQQRQVFAPIFNSPQSIESVIKNVRLDVEDDEACWDTQHQAVDGSTITRDHNSICISAYNLANKTEESDIPPQAAALMLHEYSELIGLSEDQAVRVQTIVLSELREL